MAHSIENFNLRVYGLLIHEGAVLITDENRAGVLMTKFPGGGVEKGEGIADCLIREFYEELDIIIQVDEFYYTNEFFQQSQFNKADQLHSFYFFVSTKEIDMIPSPSRKESLKRNQQGFRWMPLVDLNPDEFTFPIDKVVAGNLSRM
ncbi:MAG: NUDIX hydrolase [Flavobacteriales bacterium]|nr:NUDIX hydrolase [Flavobacteriales bacterium]